MAAPLKPHTFSVYLPSAESTDTSNRIEVTEWEAPVTVLGMIEPISADTVYRDYALETLRPLRLFADVEQAGNFPLGALVHCASRSQWGRVVAPAVVYDAEPITSHIVVICEQYTPTGTPI
jgi:hypothetical protein